MYLPFLCVDMNQYYQFSVIHFHPKLKLLHFVHHPVLVLFLNFALKDPKLLCYHIQALWQKINRNMYTLITVFFKLYSHFYVSFRINKKCVQRDHRLGHVINYLIVDVCLP